jgi:hypothetical protein
MTHPRRGAESNSSPLSSHPLKLTGLNAEPDATSLSPWLVKPLGSAAYIISILLYIKDLLGRQNAAENDRHFSGSERGTWTIEKEKAQISGGHWGLLSFVMVLLCLWKATPESSSQ